MRLLDRLNQYLVVMGIPGLLAISFLDSAAVPLAGGPDAVVLLLAWQRPPLTALIAAAAAIGSTFGCLMLYGIGQKSGEKALSRFGESKRKWVQDKMDRHGIWAIIGAVMAPPPFPTKLVILAAGVLQTGKIPFSIAVFAGRIVRYAIVGYLGAHLGNQAARVLKSNYPLISLALIGLLLLVYILRSIRNWRRPAGGRLPPPDNA